MFALRDNKVRRLVWLVVIVAIGSVTLGCAQVRVDEEGLRRSFADRIATSSFVNDFSSAAGELTFSGPDGQGGTATWQVHIESSLVEPNDLDESMPYQGRITSQWRADGKVVDYLGNMTALPQEFLDRGLAQECWAYWIESSARWDW